MAGLASVTVITGWTAEAAVEGGCTAWPPGVGCTLRTGDAFGSLFLPAVKAVLVAMEALVDPLIEDRPSGHPKYLIQLTHHWIIDFDQPTHFQVLDIFQIIN